MLQIILVSICVAAALLFMGRRMLRAVRNRGACACDAANSCPNHRSCEGGGGCPEEKRLQELKPR